jgi:hypothetical protein
MTIAQWNTSVEQFRQLACSALASGEHSQQELRQWIEEARAFATEIDPLYAGIAAALAASQGRSRH